MKIQPIQTYQLTKQLIYNKNKIKNKDITGVKDENTTDNKPSIEPIDI